MPPEDSTVVPAHEMRLFVRDLVAMTRSQYVVEIGVDRGDLSELLIAVPTVRRIWLVDPWKECKDFPQKHCDEARARVEGIVAQNRDRAAAWQMPSVKAAAVALDTTGPTPEFDFIFIDALHDYENVRADILAWLPLLREGGYIAGDDYQYQEVKDAVAHCLPDHTVSLSTMNRVWMWRKP